MNESLLQVRNEMKERKPVFIRQDNPKRRKLNYKWRKPKGVHSKIRHHFKGRRKMPSPGYKSPAEVKGLHSSGLKMIRVFSADDVKKIKKENEGIIIPKSIGMRRRLEILKKANEMGTMVLNLNADESIKKIEEFVSSKKKKSPEKKKEPPIHKESKPKEAKEKLSDEEIKEFNKKEKDRILTKKA